MTQIPDPSALIERLVASAVDGMRPGEALAAIGAWLHGNGVPLAFCGAGTALIDPEHEVHRIRWRPATGLIEDDVSRWRSAEEQGAWQRSALFHLNAHRLDRLRRRLDATLDPDEFAQLTDIRAEGGTDYVAFRTPFGSSASLGQADVVLSAWVCGRPGGFEDAEIELIARLLPVLAVAFGLTGLARNARTMLCTYLGADAAARVLDGNVVRGRAEAVQAVIWYSDLEGFTRLTEAEGARGALAFLNDHAEVLVEAIEAHGGDVLKFIGDGILAIFRAESLAHAQALDAVRAAAKRLAALTRRRAQAGQPVSRCHVALHAGEVLFGNFGSARRLDFTVLGAAVNEAARIEALSRSLDRQVVVSEAFARGAPDVAGRLVSLGRYALKGVGRPQELFTLAFG